VLLWSIAVLAPVSAAEYAWIVIRRVGEPHGTVAAVKVPPGAPPDA
jgi:hypothetical protein